MPRHIYSWIFVFTLAGCAVGPDYQPPQLQLPANWQAQVHTEKGSTVTQAWQQLLQDEPLTQLINEAQQGNLDVQVAMSRLRQARAARGVEKAGLYPELQLGASSSHTKQNDVSTTTYQTGFDASWELDIFGGKRRAVEAANAELAASEASLADVSVSLTAEVAASYIELRLLQAQQRVAQTSLQNRLQSQQLTEWRAKAGLATELDVEQARYTVEQSRAELPALAASIQQTLNQLAVLVGKAPGSLASLVPAQEIPQAPVELYVDIPAEVLQRRPDVREAEATLAAQTANVGVAIAARYPSLSLSASIGLEALSAGDLADADPLSTLAANLGWPLFNAGRLKRNVDVQTELAEQALLNYQAVVLAALQDVESSLLTLNSEQQRLVALTRAREAAERARQLSQEQYQAGLVGFETVLETERSLLSLQNSELQSQAALTTAVIQLYKALGGGWPATQQQAQEP